MSKVYGITGVAPETLAVAMAKYSRSSKSMIESLNEAQADKTAKFFETNFHKYGHASIADLAHLALGIEDISILAAMNIVDEPLWDGQERSTRYQDFNDAPYFTPIGAPESYASLIGTSFGGYTWLLEEVKKFYMYQYPRPSDMGAKEYTATIRARAFDVARYFLPLATKTSLGQITSARALSKQITRLLSSNLPEIREIATQMHDAVTQASPFTFTGEDEGPLAPTLVRHAQRSTFLENSRDILSEVTPDIFYGMLPDTTCFVDLHVVSDPIIRTCANLFYSASNFSYTQILSKVEDLSHKIRLELMDAVFSQRGAHDEWLRAMHSSPLIFDVTMDIGAYRDLNRHRRTQKILQPLSTVMGFDTPTILYECTSATSYRAKMSAILAGIDTHLMNWDPLQAMYAAPLALLVRGLFQMDFVQAAYLIELRSKSAGHFSYRAVAHSMYSRICEKYPDMAKYIRITETSETEDFFRR